MTGNILILVFSSVLAASAIFLTFRLYLRYPLKYVSFFLFYILSVNLGYYLFYIFESLIFEVGGLNPGQIKTLNLILIVFVLRPVILLGLYMFFKFICGLTETVFTPKIRISVIIAFALHTILLFVGTLWYMKEQNQILYDNIARFSDGFLIVSLYLGIGIILIQTGKMKDEYKKFSIRMFSYIFFLCQTVFVFFPSNSLKLPLGFAFILPPVLYLKYYLKRCFVETPLVQPQDLLLQKEFFKQHKITEREWEIIGLVSRGKSNQEIADLLFISLQTVKHHLYNIFKKLKIKNRVQLINFISNLTETNRCK